MKPSFKLIWSALSVCAILSCAQNAEETSKIKIITAIPVKPPTVEAKISNSLMSLMNITVGTDCYQDDMYLLVFDPAINDIIETKKIKLRTRHSNPTPSVITYGATNVDVASVISRLQSTSNFDEPLEILIPKNRDVEIGLVGTFFNPVDSNSDGICDQGVGITVHNSSQLFGHTQVTQAARQSGNVSLKIDVMHTNPGAPYNLATPPNRYRDWVQLSTAYYPKGVTTISGEGAYHVCAIIAGAAKCWGENGSGQVGDTTIVDKLIPTAVSGLSSSVTAITTGYNHTCAIVNGAAKCWGEGSLGQLGDGLASDSTTPVTVTGLTSGVTAIAAGDSHTCAIHNGVVKCWGRGTEGQLGNAAIIDEDTPQSVSLSPGVTQISAGGNTSCAIVAGSAKCWGSDTNGQLGDGGSPAQQSSPVQVGGSLNANVQKISVGKAHTCAIVSGSVKCWGDGSLGQTGQGSPVSSGTPLSVTLPSSNVTSISAGYDHTCIIEAGVAKCWGENLYGQLGNNSAIDSYSPVSVSGLSPKSFSIHAGYEQTCAITETGVQCWGKNLSGNFGNTTTTGSMVPVATNGLTVNQARLKMAHYLQSNHSGIDAINIKLDNIGSGIIPYYVPHFYPMTLDFEFSGAQSNGTCLTATPCTGMYRMTINDDQNSQNSATPAILVGTSSGSPVSQINAYNISRYIYNNY